ncbi:MULTISPECIES: glutathione peroxidase [Saccharibacillus]|uniref:glutathione peroxidase n=1 Tax=Saccharibacillus TaxID=456492 RepID=UPI00123B5C64|nr:glutathione peroxidase [Saccharibacillus sp. WB 17]MWJ33466.1 redoxin domain-containing protein [Saccharibacillus sp. WB 17]
MSSIYDFSATSISGQQISLDSFRGKTVLIVNTASGCGFTFQFEDLQKLYDRYKDRDFVILGFPCGQFADQELNTNDQIHTFCTLKYGVSFPMFEKVDVRDEKAHPLFAYLAGTKPFKGFNPFHSVAKILLPLINERHPEYMPGDSIKWNFTKFLIDPEGRVIERYEATTDPIDMEDDIEKVLNAAKS